MQCSSLTSLRKSASSLRPRFKVKHRSDHRTLSWQWDGCLVLLPPPIMLAKADAFRGGQDQLLRLVT